MTKTKKFKVPLVGHITKLKRTWWIAYVPAIGALAQSDSRRGAASTLKGNIEKMFRHEREPVTATVTVLNSVVDGADVSVTCNRPGLLEARAAEFKRMSAEVDGPIRNPLLVPVRRGDSHHREQRGPEVARQADEHAAHRAHALPRHARRRRDRARPSTAAKWND